MHSLIYVSKVAVELTQSDLDNLANNAARSNSVADVTGMLAYNGAHFMQLLEGRRDVLDELISKISKDTRHRDLVIIRRDDRLVRECPDWSMRVFLVPMERAGSANAMRDSLPESFRADTKMLFTSFGSMIAA